MCEGIGGRVYDLILHSPFEVASVSGGELLTLDKADVIRLKFNRTVSEYERREVVVNFEK